MSLFENVVISGGVGTAITVVADIMGLGFLIGYVIGYADAGRMILKLFKKKKYGLKE